MGISRSESAAGALAWPPARLSRFKAGRKIRISGRLWMNGLDATSRKEGAGTMRVPSGRPRPIRPPVHLRIVCEPAPTPLHLMFQPSRPAFPEDQEPLPLRRRCGAALTYSAHNPAHEQNQYSILKPCQMTVVYQAADQSRFIAS